MTQAALTAAVNALLASGQPITALIHRAAEAQIIGEMYDAQSRGDILSAVASVASLQTSDTVLIFRSGVAKVINKDQFGSVDGGTP